MDFVIVTADEKTGRLVPYHVPDYAIDISRDRDHIIDALTGDTGAWGRMSKGRRTALEALNQRERQMLLEHLEG